MMDVSGTYFFIWDEFEGSLCGVGRGVPSHVGDDVLGDGLHPYPFGLGGDAGGTLSVGVLTFEV